MNRNNFGRFIFVLIVIVWSVYEMYPPSGRNLIQVFRERAVNRDATFSTIVQKATVAEKGMPEKAYASLQEAIGKTDITHYFPFFDAKDQVNPTTYILNRLQREATGKIRLGLDLSGGTSFLVKMDTSSLTNATDTHEALLQAVEVLRKRVDRFGVAEPVIQPVGTDEILIQLPGLSAADQEAAKATIQKAAFLEFCLVSPTSAQDIRDHLIQPGYQVMRLVKKLPDGKQNVEELEVRKQPEMTGSGIKSAMVVRDNLGAPEIDFTLNSAATEKFGDITSKHVGDRLAIILDGQLYSAPSIISPIETGSGEITGQFDEREAFELANVLENPLRAPVHIIQSNEVDPTLGKDSIRSGLRASIIGTIAVVGFMLVYYIIGGLVANAALMLNILILLGVMCSIHTTLTLPGIAGIVLTIGMAVDANVLIFERIREEKAAGKSLRGALSAGYDKAFGTIFDSNLTTLISSVILIFMGTGDVKGFGVTLTIGVCVSLFTALVVTRLVFDWMLSKNLLKDLKMLHIVRGSKIDFMKWAIPAFTASWLLIAIGNGYGLYRGQDVLGVDFSGGETLIMKFDQAHKIGVDKLRGALRKLGWGDMQIAYQRDLSTGLDTLRVTARTKALDVAGGSDALTGRILAELGKDFPQAHYTKWSVANVGPTVGKQIQTSAILSVLLAMFGILVYVAFRYEFSFAVGAVLAIVHDVFMTLGWYFLTGRELNATTVAAILTIIGFSVNDTIVIFDRIREDLKLGVRGTLREVMNKALNQTLSRTLITSGTVFLATLSLYVFGGGVINDFAFTFLVGILTGTYSSIYIASALVLWWHKGQRPHIGAGPIQMQTVSAPVRRKVAPST